MFNSNMMSSKTTAIVSKLMDTDFTLCLKCQKPGDNLITAPQVESYTKFLAAVRHRAELGDGDFPVIARRLSQYSVEDLHGKATWHANCYKDTVNINKIARAEKAHQRTESAQLSLLMEKESCDCYTVSERPFTRSATQPLKGDHCFFCNEGSEKDVLHEVTSFNVGRQIREAVERSSNREWQVKLQPLNADDARAIDIKYHLYCYVKNVQRSHAYDAPLTEPLYDKQVREIYVDTEFVSVLRDRLSEGNFVAIDTARCLYEQLLTAHGFSTQYTNKEVKAKIVQCMPDEVEFARPYYNKPETICSLRSKNSAIRDAAENLLNLRKDLSVIMSCAKIIRRDIIEAVSKKWSFTGSLTTKSEESCVPMALHLLLKWVIQGTGSGTEMHSEDIERVSLRLSRSIIYETKSDRQVSNHAKSISRRFNHSRFSENEQVLGVAFKVHACTRSKRLVQFLHRNGHCVNYSRLLHLEAELARSVTEKMAATHGIYIPPELLYEVPIFYAVDNIDFDEDTADGKHTLHGTVIVAFQSPKNTSHHKALEKSHHLSSFDDQTTSISPDSYLRHLKGSVIPKNSPKFSNYRSSKFERVHAQHHESDTVWLVSRGIGRGSDKILNQPIPPWAGYNSLVTADDRPTTNVHTLPLLRAPANEYNTLIEVLKQAQHITSFVMGRNGKTVITFDMDLYIRVIKLQSLSPTSYSQFVFRLGEFHTVLCCLRAIGSYIENSGIDDAWIESDVYGPTTCRQILEGKHMKRALDAHVTTLQVLFDLTMELFCAENEEMSHELRSLFHDLLKDGTDKNLMHIPTMHAGMKEFFCCRILSKFEAFVMQKKIKSTLFKFLWSYMNLIETLLQFIRASRQGLWLLHLSSLERLCGLFFSQNRLKYAQYVPEYIAKMQELENSDPFIWQEFLNGNFCVKKSSISFSSIGVDHAIEHENRSMKVMGGIRGITQKPGTLSRFFLIAPELARLSKEAEILAGYNEEGRTKHHELTPAVIRHQEQRIAKLKEYIAGNNPMKIDGTDLLNFATKCVLPPQTAEDIVNSVSAGTEAYHKYTSERLVGDVSLFDKMKRSKLKNWTSTGKVSLVKLKKDTIELKENRSLFARLALAAVSRPDIDMADSIGKYEFSCISRALFASDGSLLPCTGKSQLMNILEEASEDCHTVPHPGSQSSTIIVDGMVIVQQLSATATVKTCRDFADQFIAVIARRIEHYSTFHVVFDNYTFKKSLKQATREKRRSGLQCRDYICNDNTPVKTSLHNFLASVNTKQSLTVYLAAVLLQHYATSTKICIVSTSEGAKANYGDVSSLSSNHEEADTMLVLHAAYASAKQQVVHILSPDTDVFVLALRRLPQLGPKTCVINGIGSRCKLVWLKPIYDSLGGDMVAAIPGFHAFTGCDTTGRFSGKGKKLCWKAFTKASKEVIGAFRDLGQVQQLSNEVCKLLEEFVCRLYQPQSNVTDICQLRWKMFKQSQAEAERLPPTSAALRQHSLRAHYQCLVWYNDLVPNVDLPDPTGYGWCCSDGCFVPVVTDMKPAPEAVIELMRCTCKAGRCVGQCTCFIAGMACSQLCRCEADPETCDNPDPAVRPNDESDEDDDDSQTIYQFPYFTDENDVLLDMNYGVVEDEVDNIVPLPSYHLI